jgi:AraC-like DNA-binding protein/DMSO/TMAO reductase YedYZ heme-binding membrane subunit
MPLVDSAVLLDAALRGAAVALALLLAFTLWRDAFNVRIAKVGAVFMLCLCVQIVGSTPVLERTLPCAWQALPVGISIANSVLFWIFVRTLFDDEFVAGPLHIGVWALVVALGASHCLLTSPGAPFPELRKVTSFAMRWTPFVFAMLALAAAGRQWNADLVERRRRLRIFVVLAGSAYTLIMVAIRVVSGRGQLSASSAVLDMVGLLFIVVGVAASVLTARRVDLFSAAPQHAQPVPQAAQSAPIKETASDPAEDALLARLSQQMTEGRAYRLENLTVASLASKLGVAEYRLRRAINGRLGHRNFNAYVNGLRLEEAKQALTDPARRDLPVLTIALESGFQSIGPFNRAFKAATGRTPTEFREHHFSKNMADS